jgi:hypothetical protein
MPSPVPVRRSALLAAAVAALVAAAPALAKPTSELDVYQYRGGLGDQASVDIALHVASDRPAAADAVIYVPAGYGLELGFAPGTRLGSTRVTMFRGSSRLFGSGTMVAADPRKYLHESCAPGRHLAVWLLSVGVGGKTLHIPVLVDRAPAGAVEIETSYALHVCLQPPAKTGGLRLVWLDLDGGAFRNPAAAGVYEWIARVRSYGKGAAVDPKTQFEVQSQVPLPERIALATHLDAKQQTVSLSGQVTWGGRPRPRTLVSFAWAPSLTSNLVNLGSAVTDGRGRFTFTLGTPRAGWLRANVDVVPYGLCGVTPIDVPCAGETVSPPPPAILQLKLPSGWG